MPADGPRTDITEGGHIITIYKAEEPRSASSGTTRTRAGL